MSGWRGDSGLEIAFFGSSLVSAYWNGAATYYRGILGALARRGHRITFYEPDAYDRQAHRDIPDPDWARVVVYAGEGRGGVERALEASSSADLVVKASGVGVFDEFLEGEVLSLRRPGVSVVFWDVDAPATLERVRGDPSDPFRAHIPRYDLIFTYGGGSPVVRAYEELGARGCVPIYNALDPLTHHRVQPDMRFVASLGFLGNRLPDREARVEEFFLGVAADLPGLDFILGGSGWGDRSLPENVRYLGHIYTSDHNVFNSSPLAVLNINRSSMARIGYSPPTRIFEAAGAGACIITDEWAGIEDFLEPGREVLVAGSGSAVASELEGLTPARATSIGARALERVLSDHTYARRALEVEGALALHRLSPKPISEVEGGGVGESSPPPGGLRVVILGLSVTSSWGNGHAVTYRGLVRGLSERGHDVLFLERDLPWYAENRDLPRPEWCRVGLYESVQELRTRYEGEVRGADLVIVGSYVPDGIAIGEWVTEVAEGVTAFYDIDTPVTLSRLDQGGSDYLSRDLVPRYRLYLSFTGGPLLERLEGEFGAPLARPLYCSADPSIYYPDSVRARWDLGYMGTYSSDRQPVLEELLLGVARSSPAMSFVVAGPQYPESVRWPENVERITHLSPEGHRSFYNAQRFTLNLTRASMVSAGYSPSVRLFEAAACGTPIISDYWEGLETFFEPGHEILVARSADEVFSYLHEVTEAERLALGERARARVLSGHTAAHRAIELEGYLREVLVGEPALS